MPRDRPHYQPPQQISWGSAWRIGFAVSVCMFFGLLVFYFFVFVLFVGLAAAGG